MTDEIARYNIERWRALAKADALFTRPIDNLDEDSARQVLDDDGLLGDLKGQRVLCLASGGGKQSAAFALLGASVTVFDLSEEQLRRDREMAAHYGMRIEAIQGDMRDLSLLDSEAFDIVYHPYSLNFVAEARVVFGQVARVLRSDGIYHFMCANPFYFGLSERDWDGQGYALKTHYAEGAEMTLADQEWVYDRERNQGDSVPGSREYRHTLSAIVNGLVEHGFVILRISDRMSIYPEPDGEPGSWSHFVSIAPPWLGFWTLKRREAFANSPASRQG